MRPKRKTIEKPDAEKKVKSEYRILVDFSKEASPKVFNILVGPAQRNIPFLQKAFSGLQLEVTDQKILTKTQSFQSRTKEDVTYRNFVFGVIGYLMREIKAIPNFVVSEGEIKRVAQLIRADIEKNPEIQPQISLSSASLTKEQLAELVGPNEIYLRKIAKEIEGIALEVLEGRIVADEARFSRLEPGKRLQLHFILSALEGIVLDGGKITDETIGQAVARSINARNMGLKGIAEVTQGGMQINKREEQPEVLKDHRLFSPVVLVETSEDPSYEPARVLFAKKEGLDLVRLIVNHGGEHLRRLSDAAPGATIGIDKDRIAFRGTPESVALLEDAFISFASQLDQRGIRSKEGVSQILSFVLGEINGEELKDALKATAEKSQVAQGKKGQHAVVCVMRPDCLSEAKNLVIVRYQPRTENQEKYVSLVEDDRHPVVVAYGPAGTGKTSLFLQAAMDKIVRHHRGEANAPYSRLIITKPLTTTGDEDFGFLPGDIQEKTAPFFESYYNHLRRMLSPAAKNGFADSAKGEEMLKNLIDLGIIRIAPLQFMRGDSFDNALVVIDEAENATTNDMKTFLTRIEDTSRAFVFGDLEQADKKVKYRDVAPCRLSSNISIDSTGMVHAKMSDGKTRPLASYNYLGRFEFDAEQNGAFVSRVRPNNGFARLCLMHTATPGLIFTRLGREDIQRSGFMNAYLAAEEAHSIPYSEGELFDPRGKKGSFNSEAAIKRAMQLTAPSGGTLLPLLKGAKFGS